MAHLEHFRFQPMKCDVGADRDAVYLFSDQGNADKHVRCTCRFEGLVHPFACFLLHAPRLYQAE